LRHYNNQREGRNEYDSSQQNEQEKVQIFVENYSSNKRGFFRFESIVGIPPPLFFFLVRYC